MHSFVVLFACGVASVLAIEEECLQLAKPPAMRCCNAPLPRQRMLSNESLNECLEKFGMPSRRGSKTNCEFDLCIGKKKGYVADDGTIDKKAMLAEFEQTFIDRPELVERVKKNCIDADVKEYDPEGTCELKKIAYCMRVKYAMACSEFDDRVQCYEIKVLAKKCAAQ